MNRLLQVGAIVSVLLLASVQSAQAAPWEAEASPHALTSLDGAIDAPADGVAILAHSTFEVRGWVADRSAQGWAGIDEVRLYWSRADTDDILLARGVVRESRLARAATVDNSDGAVAGFVFPHVPWPYLPAGWNRLTVYAHAAGKGWWSRSVSVYLVHHATPAAAAPPAPADPPTFRWTTEGYDILAPTWLWPTFEYLQQNNPWVLATLTQRGTRVDFIFSHQLWGAYRPGDNVIQINSALLQGAGEEALAALLTHEATHVVDHFSGRLRSVDGCLRGEQHAAEQEAAVWSRVWGAAGKLFATHIYERELNDLVSVLASDRSAFEGRIHEQYASKCAVLGH